MAESVPYFQIIADCKTTAPFGISYVVDSFVTLGLGYGN